MKIPKRSSTRWSALMARLCALSLVALCFLQCVSNCQGQGRVTIAFEGPPELHPGQGSYMEDYVESGVRFKPLFPVSSPLRGVMLYRGDYNFPVNDTTYFAGVSSLTNATMIEVVDGDLFDLVSVQLAEDSGFEPGPATVEFIGHKLDGSVVSTEFALERILVDGRPVFQSFSFGPEFTGLQWVEIPTTTPSWWMDNLVMSRIPEPSAGVLSLVCALMLVGSRRKLLLRWLRCGDKI